MTAMAVFGAAVLLVSAPIAAPAQTFTDDGLWSGFWNYLSRIFFLNWLFHGPFGDNWSGFTTFGEVLIWNQLIQNGGLQAAGLLN